jgi:hypothetical protein
MFAAKFLMDMFRGKTFKEATGYSSITDAENKMEKNYKRFGFI